MEKGQEQPPAYSPYQGPPQQPPPQGYQYGPYPGQPQAYGPPGQPGQPQAYGPPGQPQAYGPPGQPQAYGPPGQPGKTQPYGAPGQPPMYPPPQGQPMASHYMQYGNVVVQQPLTGAPIVGPPPDHMTSAILVTLCCFWPTGVIAIIKANEARNAVMRGDMVKAVSSAGSARTMIRISVLAGVVSIIFMTIIIGIYWGILINSINDDDDYGY